MCKLILVEEKKWRLRRRQKQATLLFLASQLLSTPSTKWSSSSSTGRVKTIEKAKCSIPTLSISDLAATGRPLAGERRRDWCAGAVKGKECPVSEPLWIWMLRNLNPRTRFDAFITEPCATVSCLRFFFNLELTIDSILFHLCFILVAYFNLLCLFGWKCTYKFILTQIYKYSQKLKMYLQSVKMSLFWTLIRPK